MWGKGFVCMVIKRRGPSRIEIIILQSSQHWSRVVTSPAKYTQACKQVSWTSYFCVLTVKTVFQLLLCFIIFSKYGSMEHPPCRHDYAPPRKLSDQVTTYACMFFFLNVVIYIYIWDQEWEGVASLAEQESFGVRSWPWFLWPYQQKILNSLCLCEI